jgi:Transposase DDE domain
MIATKSKSTTGWWYGLKFHTISNKNGNLIKLRITTAIIGDAGYLSSELEIMSDVYFGT